MPYLLIVAGTTGAAFLFDLAMEVTDSFQRARYVIARTEDEYRDAH